MKCHMTGSASQCSPPPTTGEWVDVTNSREGWGYKGLFKNIFWRGGRKRFLVTRGRGWRVICIMYI